jgi:hypothetical protein
MATWDFKYFKDFEKELPETVEKRSSDFSAAEKIAVLHLGFYDAGEYQEKIKEHSKETGWKAALETLKRLKQ